MLEILGQGMRLVLAGLALGALGAAAVARITPASTGLFADWGIFAAVAILLSGVALAANYVPARRATQVDPVAAIQRG